MDKRELTLLEGTLPCARTFLLYGLESSEADVATALTRLCGPVDTIDRATLAAPASELRVHLGQRFTASPVLLACVGSQLPEGVAELVPEIERGELGPSDAPQKLPETALLFVLGAADAFAEAHAKLFGLQVVGMRVLSRRHAEVAAAEAELRRRQERARQSSRAHRLV